MHQSFEIPAPPPHLGNVRGIHFIRMWKSVIYPATSAKQYGDFPCPRGIDLALQHNNWNKKRFQSNTKFNVNINNMNNV